ncbi:MAG: nucleoside deaminase [Bacillota bacterium]
MWDTLCEVWKVCLHEAWEAYCHGSVPIGAAIVHDGTVIARGRNRIFETSAPPGQVCGNHLAHAELNALLQVSRAGVPLQQYVLYTTMEPCPLCMGALYMSGLRTLHFAARDRRAGSTDLLGTTGYLGRKTVAVHGPHAQLEAVQLALKTDYFLRRENRQQALELLEDWAQDCPGGVALGYHLYDSGRLVEASQAREPVSALVRELAGALAAS